MNLSFGKKFLLSSIGISMYLLSGVSFAQDSVIGSISVKFCNDASLTKELNLQATTDKDYEICMQFSNSMNRDITIQYGFVDGVLTNDTFQNKACSTDTMTNFGQFVTQTKKLVTIPAHGSIQEKASVRFPTGMAGVSNGCLVYSIDSEEEKTEIQSDANAAFDVVVRKGYFINAFVDGTLSRDLVLKDNVHWDYTYQNNLLTVHIPLINNGDLDESITFNGELKNILGYHKSFSEKKVVYTKKEYDLQLQIDDIPWYQAFYTLKGTLNHEGKVTFDLSLSSEDINQVKTIPLQIEIFIFPRLLCIIIIGAIILGGVIRYLAKHLRFEKNVN